jgi:hypothetical protein
MKTIFLDGTLKSDLHWEGQRALAKDLASREERLLWYLDLGLFSQLALPLQDQTQHLSLKLSLEHFRNTLWNEFHEATEGLCIYQGPSDFSSSLIWDTEQNQALSEWLKEHFPDLSMLEQELAIPLSHFDQCDRFFLERSEAGRHLVRLFCRDRAAEFLSLLVNGMPDPLPLRLHFAVDPLMQPLHQSQLLCKERYARFQQIITNPEWHIESNTIEDVKIGICFPSYQCVQAKQFEGINEALQWLIKRKAPFRIIPEAALTASWDGLDFLLATPHGLSSTGKRKLLGFCAAGGTVVNTGSDLIALNEELLFSDWINTHHDN